VATVMRTEIDISNLSNGGFAGAIKNGFVLDWKPLKDCGACESSGGYCGYNITTGEEDKFLCFCRDGSINGESCKGTSISRIDQAFFFFFWFFVGEGLK
jgi:hypothetical protein